MDDGRSTHAPKKQPPGRIYVFLVTALTCYLLGVVLWKTPVRGFVARTSLSVEHGGESHLEWCREQLRDKEFYRSALKRAGDQNTSGDQIGQVVIDRTQAAAALLPKRGDPSQLSLTYFDADRLRALEVADALTEELIDRNRDYLLRSAIQTENTAASEELTDAEQKLDQAHHRLQSFLDEFFKRMMSGNRHGAVSAHDGWSGMLRLVAWDDEHPTGMDSREAPQHREQVNPHWLAIQKQLNHLYDLRQTRRKTYPAEHPSLREVDQKIAELTRELDQTPRQLEIENPHFRPLRRFPPVEEVAEPTSDANADAPAEELVDTPAIDPQPTNIAESSAPEAAPEEDVADDEEEDASSPSDHWFARVLADAQQYFLLKQAVELAQREVDYQREKLHKPLDADSLVTQSPTILLQSSEISHEIGGGPSVMRIGMLGGFALLVGMMFSGFSRPRSAFDRLETVADVEAQVPAPVVAVLTGEHTPMGKSNTRVARLIRAAVISCEFTLLLMVAAMFFFALCDSELTAHFARDPFSAMSEVLHRIMPW